MASLSMRMEPEILELLEPLQKLSHSWEGTWHQNSASRHFRDWLLELQRSFGTGSTLVYGEVRLGTRPDQNSVGVDPGAAPDSAHLVDVQRVGWDEVAVVREVLM
jgi:hypothetical protein